jgi:hypothetical protein
MSKYIITIKKVETVTKTESGSYGVVDRVPWTDEQIQGASDHYGSAQKFLAHNPLREIRGYLPDRSVEEEVETEILKQTVETLNLAEVIKAINGI